MKEKNLYVLIGALAGAIITAIICVLLMGGKGNHKRDFINGNPPQMIEQSKQSGKMNKGNLPEKPNSDSSKTQEQKVPSENEKAEENNT